MAALALRIQELDEETFCRLPVGTKECSACDPDVPGHVRRDICTRCKGSGREPLSFQSTFTQLAESRREALKDPDGNGKKYGRRGSSQGDLDYCADGDDEIQDLEY